MVKWINLDDGVDLWTYGFSLIIMFLVTLGMTVYLMGEPNPYMYEYEVTVKEVVEHGSILTNDSTVTFMPRVVALGITVTMNSDSTYTRLYPSIITGSSGKEYILLSDKMNPNVIYRDERK